MSSRGIYSVPSGSDYTTGSGTRDRDPSFLGIAYFVRSSDKKKIFPHRERQTYRPDHQRFHSGIRHWPPPDNAAIARRAE